MSLFSVIFALPTLENNQERFTFTLDFDQKYLSFTLENDHEENY